MKYHSIPRRTFLKQSALAVAAPTIIPASVLGKGARPAPSERLTVGCIGVGNNGINWMRNFLADPRVQVVAVNDVCKKGNGFWKGRAGGREVARDIVHETYAKDKESGAYKGCDMYGDFRELLARKDIDAVQVATPDHWHALQVIAAAKAKKHIYGQKPLSLTVEEGRKMSDAVRDAGVTFQTGSQQRSMIHFRRGLEMVRAGLIGKVHTITVGLPGGHPDYSNRGAQKDEIPVPEGLDYDMWLGPAPEAYYCNARLHVNWRWILDYSGGQLTDWGAHHLDIAQWAMGNEKTGPVEFTNLTGDFPARTELYNTATSYNFECRYKDGLVMKVGTKQRGGVTFEGEDGKWIHTNRGRLEANPKEILRHQIEDDKRHFPVSKEHVVNFVDAVYAGTQPIAPIEDAHRTISIAHLANIAMQLGREKLAWNPDNETIQNDQAASKMLSREYRGPWKL